MPFLSLSRRPAGFPRLPWPLPALLAWLAAWAAWAASSALGGTAALALLIGCVAGCLSALPCAGRWRRMLAAGGFPLSALVMVPAAVWPPWFWLLLLLPLLLFYPLRAWRDAPFFPTPAAALAGLDAIVGMPAPRRVLDAGCGLGHGLSALRALWPQARLEGVEWSRPLSRLAALRCRWARVVRGDMWSADWSGYELVYVFQRPESMRRAHAKAAAEMAPGSWLVSLEFAVPGATPVAALQGSGRRPIWVYRPAGPAAAPGQGGLKQASTGPARRR